MSHSLVVYLIYGLIAIGIGVELAMFLAPIAASREVENVSSDE